MSHLWQLEKSLSSLAGAVSGYADAGLRPPFLFLDYHDGLNVSGLVV